MKKISWKALFFIFCITIHAKVTASDPANPNAGNDVKQILNFYVSLASQADHRLISGQFIGYSGGINNYGMITGIYNNTGKWVGIVGSDYVDWSNGQHIKYNLTNPELIKAWKAGSLVALQVHMTNPANPNGGGLNDTWNQVPTLIQSETDESFKDIKAYPNPMTKGSSLILTLKGFTDDEIRVSVYDPAGKVITRQDFRGSNDGRFEVKNTRGLHQGIYLLFVESQTKSAAIHVAVN